MLESSRKGFPASWWSGCQSGARCSTPTGSSSSARASLACRHWCCVSFSRVRRANPGARWSKRECPIGVRSGWRPVGALLATAIAVLCSGRVTSAQVFDPELRFRQLTTEHFVLYFHQREERVAERLAQIVEETWRALEQPSGVTPPQRTRVVLADQTELFNGYATPVPYNTIVLYAVTPSGSESEFSDWLRLIFTHEFTHIVHLDRSDSWARIVRGIFGRTPYAFPNLFLPPWQVEGLATYEESSITGEGR